MLRRAVEEGIAERGSDLRESGAKLLHLVQEDRSSRGRVRQLRQQLLPLESFLIAHVSRVPRSCDAVHASKRFPPSRLNSASASRDRSSARRTMSLKRPFPRIESSQGSRSIAVGQKKPPSTTRSS